MNPQAWTFRDLDEDSFIERFRPTRNPLDRHAGYDFGDGGCLFSATGKELQHVLAQKPSTLWTLVEGDEGQLVIESGLHLVNRLGYLVASAPVEDRTTYTVVLS